MGRECEAHLCRLDQAKSQRLEECLLEHPIQPVQLAYTSGKNVTDGTMTIDAIELLWGRTA